MMKVEVFPDVLKEDYFGLRKEAGEQQDVNQKSMSSPSRSSSSSARLVGAIHQGTSHTRFVLFTCKGRVAASAVIEVPQILFPPVFENNHIPNERQEEEEGKTAQEQPLQHEGWHEQDPLELFTTVQAVVQAMGDELKQSQYGIDLHQTPLAALGITHQRETTIAWNHRTGIPYYNAIVWDDTRTQAVAEEIAQGDFDRLRQETGLPLAAYFVGTKVRWMLDHVPALRQDLADPIRQKEVRFGTVDSWLIYQLTGKSTRNVENKSINSGGLFLTDVTNASRWLFMNLHTAQWEQSLVDEVCGPYQLPIMTCLPKICPNCYHFGVCGSDNGVPYLEGVSISAVMGDQQASLFGHGAFSKGDAKNTYGSALFLMMNTGTTPMKSPRLLTTIAYQLKSNEPVYYALEGGVSHCGSTIQWLQNQLQIIPSTPEIESLATVRNDGLYFVPAFAGLFAPRWRPDARACLFGLTTSHHKGHLCRAALEAPAYHTREIFEAIVESGCEDDNDNGVAVVATAAKGGGDGRGGEDAHFQLNSLRVDGGGTANNLMMQFQADMLNVPVVKHVVKEIACLGVAFCAGLEVGVWKDLDEVRKLWNFSKIVFLPCMSEEERHRNWSGWNKAVSKTLGWLDRSNHNHPSNNNNNNPHNATAVPTTMTTTMTITTTTTSCSTTVGPASITSGLDLVLLYSSTAAFCVSMAIGALMVRTRKLT